MPWFDSYCEISLTFIRNLQIHEPNARECTIILLGIIDYKVAEVWGGEDRVMVKTEVKEREKCPHCSSDKV